MVLAPVAAFSQVEEEQQDPASLNVDQQQANSPATGTGPWQNSAGASVGTRDNNSSSTTARPAAPNAGAGTTVHRPGAGSTADGRDPGGNPDVPFDDNMNLAFLAVGVVFAFVVARKRLKLKPAQVNRKA